MAVTQMPDTSPQLRVLAIDNSVDNAEALAVLLDLMGCVTAVAFSGTEGIAAAAGFQPHRAIIDLEMYGMSGCEVARQFRLSQSEMPMRLICLTGRGQPEDRRICMDAGFDDFFTKPMSSENLEQVVPASNAAIGSRSQ
jgi:CheY-like chemotaxis protein